MESEQTVLSILKSTLKPAIYQLEIASEKVKDLPLAKTAVNSAISLINQIEPMVTDQHNKDVDEFNGICDDAERLQSELDNKSLELLSLKSNIDEIKLNSEQKLLEAEKLQAELVIQKAALKDQTALVKYYKQLQPEKLKSNLADLKKRLDEARRIKDALKSKSDKNKKDAVHFEKKLNQQIAVNVKISDENLEMKKRIEFIDGNVTRKAFRKEDSEVDCFIYTYEYPLVFGTDDESIRFIDGIEWHKEIKTAVGINVNVSVTDWLMPVYPLVKDIAKHIPDSINDELHRQIIERCESTHPDLIAKVNWAKDTYLDTIPGIDKKLLDKLADAGMITVFSVVNLPKSSFLTYMKKRSPNPVRGVTQLHIDVLFSVLEKHAEEYMQSFSIAGIDKQVTADTSE